MTAKRNCDDPEFLLVVSPGYTLSTITMTYLVYVAYALQDVHPDRFFNMLLIPSAGVFGWVVGILLSPTSQQQQQQFQTIGRALATFVSGFLLAKLSPLFDRVTSNSQLWTLILGVRLLIALVSFFLGLLFVFVGRTIIPLENANTKEGKPST